MFNFASSNFFFRVCYLHLVWWIPSKTLLARFDNEFTINLVVSINSDLHNIFFVIYYPILSIVLFFILLKL